jgi:hypothetical protein
MSSPSRSRRRTSPAVGLAPWIGRVWWAETNSTMRPLRVVVVDVDAETAFEVAAVEDQQPVETLRTDGSDETLGNGVRSRRPHRCLHGVDAFAAQNLVEGGAVLALSVADQGGGRLDRRGRARGARVGCTNSISLQVDRFGTDVCAPQRVDEASSARVDLNFRPSLPRPATLKLEAG